jgi:hypothetical protein
MQKAGKSFGLWSRGKLADIDERTRLIKRAQMIAGDVASTSRD